MLAVEGHLGAAVDVYVINRGYEDLAERLNALGANIETVPRHLEPCRSAQPKSVSTQARARGRVGGGAVMSAVIRGSGAVWWPALRCQSFSASIRLPRSARARNTP